MQPPIPLCGRFLIVAVADLVLFCVNNDGALLILIRFWKPQHLEATRTQVMSLDELIGFSSLQVRHNKYFSESKMFDISCFYVKRRVEYKRAFQ